MPHLTQDTIWESDKTQESNTHKRAKRSALSQQVTTRLQGIDKTAWQTPQIKKKIHKRSTALTRRSKTKFPTVYLQMKIMSNENYPLSVHVMVNRFRKFSRQSAIFLNYLMLSDK